MNWNKNIAKNRSQHALYKFINLSNDISFESDWAKNGTKKHVWEKWLDLNVRMEEHFYPDGMYT